MRTVLNLTDNKFRGFGTAKAIRNTYCVFSDAVVPVEDFLVKFITFIPNKRDIRAKFYAIEEDGFAIIIRFRNSEKEIKYTFKKQLAKVRPFAPKAGKDAEFIILTTSQDDSCGFAKYADFTGFISNDETLNQYIETVRAEFVDSFKKNIVAGLTE